MLKKIAGKILMNSDGNVVDCPCSCGGGDGTVEIGVLTSRPAGGYGPAAYRKIIVHPDGSWEPTGEEIPVIIPKL